MTEPAENYHSTDVQRWLRGQAFRVWAVATSVVLVWVTLIVLPTAVSANISSPIYHFFSFICHQMPERSFHIGEHAFAVCSRCFGVYFGLLVGLIAYPFWRSIEDIEPLPRIWLFASMVPIAVDWSLGVFGIWDNNHASRFITGLILGFACATYIIPALVEIARNILQKPAR